jgi:fumarate hydratase, class II
VPNTIGSGRRQFLAWRQEASPIGFVTEQEFDRVVDPVKMVKSYLTNAGEPTKTGRLAS